MSRISRFSEQQQDIAKALKESPKTIEQLREELGINARELNEELKKLINMKLVERKEEKYKLIDYIEQKLGSNRKEEYDEPEGAYIANMIIEGTSEDKETLKKEMDVLEERIKKEPFKILHFERSEPEEIEVEEEKKANSEFIEVKVTTPKVSDMIYLAINYGPSSIEILEPDTTEIKMDQLQNILNDVASGVHYYTSIILQQRQAVEKMKQQIAMLEKERRELGLT